MKSSEARPAVFLDRDQTLIEDSGYIDDPDQVWLLAGVAEAVARLHRSDYAVVVVTNQSGVARGRLTEEQLAAVHERMRDLLRDQGADLDAIYYCPYLDGPEAVVEAYRLDSELRKPRPGMLHRAAEEMGLDLSASWMIGDSVRDVEAGRAAGCRTVLIDRNGDAPQTSADQVAADLTAAVDYILGDAGVGNMKRVDTEQGPADSHADSSRPPGPRSGRRATEDEPTTLTDATAVLEEILEELRTIRREKLHEDFSFGKLAGAIAQAFALCAIGWGLYAWLDAAADRGAAQAATIRLLAGIAFQLMALTFFAAASRR